MPVVPSTYRQGAVQDMRRLEKVEENKFVKKVTRELDAECIKLSTAGMYGRRGRADRLVLLPGEKVVFFEFKRDGEEPTKQQAKHHKRLRSLGFKVYVVYRAQVAYEICRKALRSKAVPEGVHQVRSVSTICRILPGPRPGKDRNHSVHLQDTKESRRRRRAVRAG